MSRRKGIDFKSMISFVTNLKGINGTAALSRLLLNDVPASQEIKDDIINEALCNIR
jgi:hypothetical protein